MPATVKTMLRGTGGAALAHDSPRLTTVTKTPVPTCWPDPCEDGKVTLAAQADQPRAQFEGSAVSSPDHRTTVAREHSRVRSGVVADALQVGKPSS